MDEIRIKRERNKTSIIIDEDFLVTDLQIYDLKNASLSWLKENRFEIIHQDKGVIMGKQRIHDGGEGLHPRDWYKDINLFFQSEDENININMVFYSPINLNHSNKKKAKLYWNEYVKKYLEHMNIEIPRNKLLSLFPTEYYSNRIKDQNKLLVWVSILNILLLWRLFSSYDVRTSIILIVIVEVILVHYTFEKKKEIIKQKTSM